MRRSGTRHGRGQEDPSDSIHRSCAREFGVLLWVLAIVLIIAITMFADMGVAMERIQHPPVRIISQFVGVGAFFVLFPACYKFLS